MGDEEMQEQTVAAVPDSEEPVNPHDLQKDSSGVEKDQNLGEKPQSSHPEDNTLTLDSDVTLSDAAVGVETDGDAKAGGEKNDDVKLADNSANETNADGENQTETELKTPHPQEKSFVPVAGSDGGKKWKTWLPSDSETGEFDEAGTPEEQEMFMKDLESFHKEHFLEFKPPKFYGQPLNCLKLWRAVIKLGGYDLVTASKLWRQVGESFHPPKTCTTVSWTFRIFYEKALVEYEKYLSANGELELPGLAVLPSSGVEKEASSHQGSGSGRTIRDSAARAMQGWHSQRLGYGEDKGATPTPKREKNLKNIVMQKHRSPNCLVLADKPFSDGDKQGIAEVIDVGPPADWVKINVLETKDCFEIYALVPGLLREEVRVQSDPAGRLVITGQPEQLDNPWGITPFKKVVNLPGRIDPLQTSAIVSLHGRLFVRVPFEH